MASAKFLEEALNSKDVDESAVSAIVGSLENQLSAAASDTLSTHGQRQPAAANRISNNLNQNNNNQQTAAKQHGVRNVSQIYVNNATTKLMSTNTSAANLSTNVSSEVHTSTSSSQPVSTTGQSFSRTGGMATQVNNNTSVQNSIYNQSTSQVLTKPNEIKLIYTPGSSGPNTSNVGVVNNRIFSGGQNPQNLPNGGSVNITSQQVATNIQTGKSVVIKSTTPGQQGLVTVPMNVVTTSLGNNVQGSGTVTSMPGVMTISKPMNSMSGTTTTNAPQMVATSGANSQLMPGMQIVNVRTAGGAPNQAMNKMPPRVVLGSHMLSGARPGAPITLQSLQQLGAGQQGHLLLKTETGQYQLIRVGPAPGGTGAPGSVQLGSGAAANNLVTSNQNTAAPGNNASAQQQVSSGSTPGGGQQTTTYRIQTIPAAVSRLNTFTATGHPPLTLRKTIVQQGSTAIPPTLQAQTLQAQNAILNRESTATNVTQSTAISTQPTAKNSVATVISSPATNPPTGKGPNERSDVKEKCRRFLVNLLELSSREPRQVEKNVQNLIQELIDMKVEPELFCERLEKLLNASPQPCLIGFLKRSLPLLRQALVQKEMVIEGIRPPPYNVVYPVNSSQIVTNISGIPAQQIIKAAAGQLQASGAAGAQTVRLMTQPGGTTAIVRSGGGPGTTNIVGIPQGGVLRSTIPGTAIRGAIANQPRMIGTTTLRQQPPYTVNNNVIVTSSQPPALQLAGSSGPSLYPTSASQIRVATSAQSTGAINQSPSIQMSGTQQHIASSISTSIASSTVQNQTMGTGSPQAVGQQSLQPQRPFTPKQNTSRASTAQIISVTKTFPPTSASTSSAYQPQIVTVVTSTPTAGTVTTSSRSATPQRTMSGVTKTTAKVPSTKASKKGGSAQSGTTGLQRFAATSSNSFSAISGVHNAASSTSMASSMSSSYVADDDINDVAAMGGVNLAEETQRILGSTEYIGTQIRSCKDELFLHPAPLQYCVRDVMQKYGLDGDASHDVLSVVSHATQELMKNMVEKLAVICDHRMEVTKNDTRYEITKDVRSQIKFLEELDRAERKRHDEQERELLLRAAKSRSKTEDPEQAKLKARAKEMQRAQLEELRQREANLTALQAIGPRKKPKLDADPAVVSSGANASSNTNSAGRSLPLRPRIKRVNMRDMLFYMEEERDKRKHLMLYKAYLK